MKINISEIVKTDGASLNIEFNQPIEELESVVDDFIFNKPVNFIGTLLNYSGILKLNGRLKTEYATVCYRCLNEVTGHVDLIIKEEFLDGEKNTDSEAYIYKGNYIELDKVLKDSIILNLPMKQACSKDCKGLCPKCGANLNQDACQCKEDDINPRMEVLKDFFNK